MNGLNIGDEAESYLKAVSYVNEAMDFAIHSPLDENKFDDLSEEMLKLSVVEKEIAFFYLLGNFAELVRQLQNE
jgi:hypothetical protein